MNAILSATALERYVTRTAMAVQRKVFRIEERARPRSAGAAVPEPADGGLRSEVMAELQSLRALIAPRAEVSREALEQARAQIAEAQAYKQELAAIHAAVEQTKSEMTTLQGDTDRGERTARASRELAAIVGGTENATKTILQAAEEIDQAAAILTAAVKNPQDAALAHDIQDRVVQIFEACNFQDLTGQRVSHVVETLRFIEERMARLLEIWRNIEQFAPVVFGEKEGDRRLLNGPKLPGDSGHSTQDDIDGIFVRA
jgi:chemotaxis protein CheZ